MLASDESAGLSDSSLLLSWLVMFIAINFFMTFVIAIIMAIFFYKSTSILIAKILVACLMAQQHSRRLQG